LTVSTDSTVKGGARAETRLDGFFALVVDGVQRTGKTSYVSKGLAYASALAIPRRRRARIRSLAS
jgi:hypothetical protein